jgi:hypothetical protein
LQVSAVDQITVAGDRACHLLAPICLSVKGLLDGFEREVSVAAIDPIYPVLYRSDYILS